MSCGRKLLDDINSKGITIVNPNVIPNVYAEKYLYTAYLGRVKVPVLLTNNPNKVLLECKSGIKNDIILRVIDAKLYNINCNTNPRLMQLVFIPAATINISENIETFYQIQLMEMQKAVSNNDSVSIEYHKKYLEKFQNENKLIMDQLKIKYASIKYEPEQLRNLYVKNSYVDIHFQTSFYLKFLQETLKRESINNNKLLLSLCNVPDLDNAFFTGEYMVYGNGKDLFYPLCSIDVSAHELTHGLVDSTAGLEYLGHSGALNESFSDIISTAFEFWLYKKFNENKDTTDDINGASDWLIGEDIGKKVKYLRNMRDPTSCEMPQPKQYKGQYWINPNQEQNDYGGVHVNSGVPNHCFYQFTQTFGVDVSLPIFYNCLLKLNEHSDFIDFRDKLIECTSDQNKNSAQKCLDCVGLTNSAVSDWNKYKK